MAQSPKALGQSTTAGAQARIQSLLTEIATGKALQSPPYSLTAAQAQAVGVACLTALLSADATLRNAMVHVLLGK